ncbi:hypothetical protein ACHQM5_029139 [Ranunculus cassubicifolius]
MEEKQQFTEGEIVEINGANNSWFPATIVKLPNTKSQKSIFVQYMDGDGSTPVITMFATTAQIRPLPPSASSVQEGSNQFLVDEKVEFFHGNEWCKGKIVQVFDEFRYKVEFFDCVEEKCMVFEEKDLRVFKEWVDGEWVFPQDQDIGTKHDHDDVGNCNEMKEGEQYEPSEPNEQYHEAADSIQTPDQHQCLRTKHKRRCSKMASPGSIYCEKHHLERDAYNERRRKGRKIENRYITHLPSGELRCRKTGQHWQCPEEATSGLYCEKHGLKEDIRNKNRRKGDGRPSRALMALLSVGEGQSTYSGNEGSNNAQLTGLKRTMEDDRDSKIGDVMTKPNRREASSGAVDPGRKIAKRRRKRSRDKEIIPDENVVSESVRTQATAIFETQTDKQTREMIPENSIENPLCKTPTNKIAEVVRTEGASTTDNGIGNIGIICTESPMKWNESQDAINEDHFRKAIEDELNDTIMLSFWTDHNSDELQENEGVMTTKEVMSVVDSSREKIEAERDIAETEKDIPIPAYKQIYEEIEDLNGPLENGQSVGEKESMSQDINMEHDHGDVGKCDQIKDREQYESSKPDDEQYHSPPSSAKKPDQQCVRDGKRWRCSNMASPGSIYCEKHHSKRDTYNLKRRKGPKKESHYITHLPSGELRCRKTGKQWQCHEKATSRLYCDKHGLKEDIRNKNRRKGDGRPTRALMALLSVGEGQPKYSGNEGSNSDQRTGLKLTMEDNRDSKIGDVMTNANSNEVSSGAVDPERKVAKRQSGRQRSRDKEIIPDENGESELVRTQTTAIFETQTDKQTREMIPETSIENPLCKTPTNKVAEVVETEGAPTTDNGIGNIGIKCTESPVKCNESQNPINEDHFREAIEDEQNDTIMLSFCTDHDSDDELQENEGLITTKEVMSAVDSSREQIEAERYIAETEKDISIPAEQIESERDIAETEKDISIPAEQIEDIAETEKDISIPAEQIEDIAETEKDISIPAEQIEDIAETEKDISIPAEKVEAERDIAETEKDISIPAEQIEAERDIAETEKDISIPAEQIEDIAETEKDIPIPAEKVEAERDIAETENYISIPAEYNQIYKEIEDAHGPLENGQPVGEKESVAHVTLVELLKMAHKLKCLTVESVTETMISDFKRTIEIGRLFNYNVQWLDENLKRLADLYEKRLAVISLEQDVRSCNMLLEATQEELNRMEEASLIAKKKFDDMVKCRDDAVAKLVAVHDRFGKFEFVI